MFYRKTHDPTLSEDVLQRIVLQQRILQVGLLLLGVICLVYLGSARKPWDRKVMERITQAAPSLEQPQTLISFSGWMGSEVTHYETLRPKEHGVIGLWYAAVAGTGLCLLLAGTIQLWMPRGEKEDLHAAHEHEADEENRGDTGLARLHSSAPLFYLLVLAALAVGGWLRAPRLTHSFWNDEAYAVSRFIHGKWEVQEGHLGFQKATWTDTLHEQRNGNNHLLFSLAARCSLGVWRSFSAASEEAFSESAVRMPSFIAGLATIALLAWLGWETGLVWAGIGAAWLLTLHPWHIRYAVEARGYSLALFGIVLSLVGLVRALRSQRLAPWLVFALGEAVYLLSFAGSLYVAVAVNAVALTLVILRRQWHRLTTLCAMNILAAVPVLLIMLPSVPQLLGFLAHDNSPRLPAGWHSILDIATHLAAGVLPVNPEPALHDGTSWQVMRSLHPDQTALLGYGLLGLSALGCLAALFEGFAARLSIVALAFAGALAYLHGTSSGSPNLSWYYVYLLLPMSLAVSLVVARLGKATPLVLAAVTVFFGWSTSEARRIMIEVNRQPMRQTLASVREKDPQALTATFGVSDRQAHLYNPHALILGSVEELEEALKRAETEGRSFYLYVSGQRESSLRSPQLFQRLTQSTDFRQVAEFKGTEALFSYTVWQNTLLRSQ